MKRMTKVRLLHVASLTMCVCLSWTARARADAVTDWNAIAVQTIVNAMAYIVAMMGKSCSLDMAAATTNGIIS